MEQVSLKDVSIIHGWKNPRGFFDPDELVRRLREATPNEETLLEIRKAEAYTNRDKLIELGGRPSRVVRPRPSSDTIYRDGVSRIRSENNTEWIDDFKVMYDHWTAESSLFMDELYRWQRFRNWQRQFSNRDLALTASGLEGADQTVKSVSENLNHWREYGSYHNQIVCRLRRQKVRRQRAFGRASQLGAQAKNEYAASAFYSALNNGLREQQKAQVNLEEAEKILVWIQDQIPQILQETLACADLSMTSSQQLEIKMREEATVTYQRLQISGAFMNEIFDEPRPTQTYLERLCHWNRMTIRFADNLREWMDFRQWRKGGHMKAYTPCLNTETSQLWCEYLAYQQSRLDWTKSWMNCWQKFGGCGGSRGSSVHTLPHRGWDHVTDCIGDSYTYMQAIREDILVAELRLEASRRQFEEAGSKIVSLIEKVVEEVSQFPSPIPSPQWPQSSQSSPPTNAIQDAMLSGSPNFPATNPRKRRASTVLDAAPPIKSMKTIHTETPEETEKHVNQRVMDANANIRSPEPPKTLNHTPKKRLASEDSDISKPTKVIKHDHRPPMNLMKVIDGRPYIDIADKSFAAPQTTHYPGRGVYSTTNFDTSSSSTSTPALSNKKRRPLPRPKLSSLCQCSSQSIHYTSTHDDLVHGPM